jgi:alpha-galactosidase
MTVPALLVGSLLAAGTAPGETVSVHRVAGLDLSVLGDRQGFTVDVAAERVEDGVDVVSLTLSRAEAWRPPRLTLKWSLPSHDVAGQWTTGRHLAKTLRPDFAGSRLTASMLAREAPVSCLFSSADRNVLTFAVSDALDTVLTGSAIREEDGRVYNEVVFFSEPHPKLTRYAAQLRIDRRAVPYWTALAGVAAWWARQPGYAPSPVPEAARQPVYSTWYSYHQSVDSASLLAEMALARPMGFASIIVDDGWQTLDTGRGYAFTGDWEPQRMPDMKAYVEATRRLGAKVLLWYAVPFVGKSSKAAERFKDKSLRFEERLGAYVLDPRFREVREYLIDTYRRALRDWDVNGFKLDFIERFVADDQTVLEATGGRDFASVNEATDRLLTDVLAELRIVKPDVMIEFRQPYIGPLVRKYGNMFRASDCPNSYLANRVKTVDLRLLSGDTAVHADMVMWHPGEPVEIAALQLNNVLFAVPQVSVRLADIPDDHRAMVRFYVDYWLRNRAVLLDGTFEPLSPGANYPVVTARRGGRQVTALHADTVVRLDAGAADSIDVVNAKSSTSVIVAAERDLGRRRVTARDCRGRVVATRQLRLGPGLHPFTVPISGVLTLERIARPARPRARAEAQAGGPSSGASKHTREGMHTSALQ